MATQQHELSSARGNFLTVLIDLATGQTRTMDDAEAVREAAEATRRQADKSGGLLLLSSSSA
jgi:hypothetical protein